MNNILTFKVEIEGLENKIWRKIEIIDRLTVADLAYTILSSFNSLAYHLYNITYKNKIYDCWVCPEEGLLDETPENATIIPLKHLGLKENDKLEMEYDYGSTTNFIITYLGTRKQKDILKDSNYPYIVDGGGKGMLDDITQYELKEIVDDTDKLGYSNHYFTPGYETTSKFDYRKYSIISDNKYLKGKFIEIKNGYELPLEYE